MKALVDKQRKAWSRTDKFYAAFSTALLVLITIYMSTEAVFGQEMWIVHSGDPGGPAAFLANNVNVWYQTMGTTASVILIMLSDALLVSVCFSHHDKAFEMLTAANIMQIYRMYVVWPDFRLVAFPCLLYVASIGKPPRPHK